jgi:hypothetical protein
VCIIYICIICHFGKASESFRRENFAYRENAGVDYSNESISCIFISQTLLSARYNLRDTLIQYNSVY